MISCTHNTSSVKYWTFCSMRQRTLLHGLDSRRASRSKPLSTTSMTARACLWSKSSRFMFFIWSRSRLMFFYFSSCRLDGHSDNFHTIHTVLFIQLGHKILFSEFCSYSFFSRGDTSNFESLMVATCFSFPFVEKQVANTWECIDNN